VFRGDYAFNDRNNIQLDALRSLLSFRLTERLRENEGGAYSPAVSLEYTKIPCAKYNLTISFGCSPKNAAQLIQSTLAEIKVLKVHGASDSDMQKFIAQKTRQIELGLTNNDFWLNYLVNQNKNEEDINNILTYRSLLEQIPHEDIKSSAKVYLNESNLVQIVEMPVAHEQ
jgi:zinc protease